MTINEKYLLDALKTLLEIPSPTGFTKDAVAYVETAFKDLGIEFEKTVKGALIGCIKGKDDSRHRLLSAHVDTLGGMVKEIKGSGRLKLTQIGGYAWNTIEGEYCTIHTADGRKITGTIMLNAASSHVHGEKTSSTPRSADTMEIRLDEVVASADDAKALGIEVGDFVSFDPRVQITESGYVKSRHLDDKACVACLLSIIKTIKEEGLELPYTTHFFISNYEEVGHGSSASIPEKVVEFMAVDMAAPGEGQTSHEHKVTICAKDSSGPYDYALKGQLVELAKQGGLDYVVDIYPFYGSDASAALRAGWAFKHSLIGPGVDASHSFERTHTEGLVATSQLGLAYVMSPMVD